MALVLHQPDDGVHHLVNVYGKVSVSETVSIGKRHAFQRNGQRNNIEYHLPHIEIFAIYGIQALCGLFDCESVRVCVQSLEDTDQSANIRSEQQTRR